MSNEAKAKISQARLGQKKSAETRRRMSEAAKKRPADYYEKTIHSPESRKLAAEKLKGRTPWQSLQPMTEAFREARRQAMLGQPKSIEHRRKMSETRRGEKSHFWIDGRHKANYSERQSAIRKLPYRLWRKAVFTKANSTCELKDETCSGRLQAHHIKGWTEFPDLRYDPSNGQALCKSHHERTDNFAGRALKKAA